MMILRGLGAVVPAQGVQRLAQSLQWPSLSSRLHRFARDHRVGLGSFATLYVKASCGEIILVCNHFVGCRLFTWVVGFGGCQLNGLGCGFSGCG